MTVEGQRSKRRRKRLALVAAAIAVLLALLIGPPYVSISRYKSRIAQLVSNSLGRPVRLSSVELRILPQPGFVITDLTVDEDPAYGAEPVLHANSVVAVVRLFSLWRGRLELSRISVDEASLNLVRNDEGRWNLDPFFQAASTNSSQREVRQPPYLEATNSRINVKKGIEKLPYSLVNADLSFWQENSGDWRFRLRGQPARTDVSLDLADTGILRMEGRLKRADDLRQMPIHLDIDWREAQLGQLSRLILGSDPGWRGDLTGEMQLDGTAERAQVKTRLRAVGVHRSEFAPEEPLDFDANCSFAYHYLDRSVEKLSCDSPLGDGHVMLSGELPGDRAASFSVEAQRVPVSAGLDVLRTLRSGFNSDLEATGSVSGRITYDPNVAGALSAQVATTRSQMSRRKLGPVPAKDPGPLSGSLTVTGLRLSGGGLTQPILVGKPATLQAAEPEPGHPQALTATVAIPAGATTPITIGVQFSAHGYQATVRGQASLPHLREFAHLAGLGEVSALDGLAGDPATLDLSADGPWLPVPLTPNPAPPGETTDADFAPMQNSADALAGTVTLHNANWRSDALASHVEIVQAVLHLSGSTTEWNPIEFSYGPVKGSATFHPALTECPAGEECVPQLDLHFVKLDAAQLQAALLGAKRPSTGISALIERFSASSAPPWPRINGNIYADSLKLGPVAIGKAVASLQVDPAAVNLKSFEGDLLGGKIIGSGKLTQGDKPAYAFDGELEAANATTVCRLFSLQCAGGPINAQGHVTLSGFTDRDLAASASGSVHFEWRHGSLAVAQANTPGELQHFDRWAGDAGIGSNHAVISASEVEQGSRKAGVEATVTFSDQPSIRFSTPGPGPSPKQ